MSKRSSLFLRKSEKMLFFYKEFNNKRLLSNLSRSLKAASPLLLNFSCNDYLGLSTHPAVIHAVHQEVERVGMGVRASRLIGGHSALQEALETQIAADCGQESALIFASGYQANVSVLEALLNTDLFDQPPLVFSDRLNHASLHAGCALAKVRQIRYNHLDLNHLAYCLKKAERQAPGAPKFVITESVFSMDGGQIDFPALQVLCRAHQAFLYVDEAHAVGVLGQKGYGLCTGLQNGLIMGTFSKGLGVFGGYVAGPLEIKQYLMNRCGGLIYTTALPSPIVAAIYAAWMTVPDLAPQRRHLQVLASALQNGLEQRQYKVGLSPFPPLQHIVPVMMNTPEEALMLSHNLEAVGIIVSAIRPPTVPQSLLRFSLTARHTFTDIERVLYAMQRTLSGH